MERVVSLWGLSISAGIQHEVMMSGKRRHQQGIARRKALAERDLLAEKARGLPVNPGELAPYISDDTPGFIARGFYSDRPYVCQGCGEHQVWTAKQQKWWYEVVKGPVQSFAKFCRACRHASRQRDEPHPYKNVGLLMAKVRSEIEPRLTARRFGFVGRGPQNVRQSRSVRSLSLEYSGEETLLSISWDQRMTSLTADLLDAGGDDFRRIAVANLDGCRSAADYDSRIEAFVQDIDLWLSLPADDIGKNRID